MKYIVPSVGIPLTLADAKKTMQEPLPEPLPEPVDPLAFARQLHFGSNSEIDEKAVLLVELSVIVYSKLDLIRRIFAKLSIAPTVIDACCDRAADLVWLEFQPRANTVAKAGDSNPFSFLSINTSAPLHPSIEPNHRNRAPRVVAFRHKSDVYIAFRGSATCQDWRRNCMLWPAARLPMRHKGFEITWAEVRAEVEAWLEEVSRDLGCRPSVHLGGHSLGGAVATLAAIDLAAVGYPVARIVTIGSPRVGGWGFRKRYRSTDATKNEYGTPRCLDQVTTRFRHGTDIITTILPPPPLTAHVVPAEPLEAKDKLSAEDFIGNGPFDMTPYTGGVSVGNNWTMPGYKDGLASTVPMNRVKLMRRMTTQVLTWIAMHFHSNVWVRLLPFLPAFFEHARVSAGQHKSARYLMFMPSTVVGSAYFSETKQLEQ